ncbi:hypothetical protein RBB50_003064 [Rhinocladiella similis]
MPLLSSTLLVRTHSLTLVLFSYYLLTSPWTLVSSAPIWLLGESMFVRAPAYAPDHLHPSDPRSNLPHQGGGFRPPALLQNPARGPGTIPALTGTTAERELFAVVAVLLVAYALMQFVFAGDLTLILPSGPTSIRAGKQPASPAASSARLAEELHTLLTAQSRWLTLAGLHVVGSSALVFWIYMFYSRTAAQSGDYYSISDLLANRVTFTVGLTNMLFWGYLWTTLKDEGREIGKLLARRRAMEEEDE